MEDFREILLRYEVLLLFVVIGSGYIIGKIRILGFSLGIAGVVFSGLAFGAWHPDGTKAFSITHQISELGLILCNYSGLILQ
jgi:putative transport protein